jgi:hypothetical protein
MRKLECWFRGCLQWLSKLLQRLKHASLFTTRQRPLEKLYHRLRAMLPRRGRKESDEQRDYRKLLEYNQLMKVFAHVKLPPFVVCSILST